jgi:phosphatidylglycerol:prolipoprotein diacylglycerol transferase
VAYLTYPLIDPVLVRIGPIGVRYYGLAYVLAFLAAHFALARLNDRWKLGLSVDDRMEVLLAAILGVVLGARIGYVVFYGLSTYARHPLEVFAVWDGGMSFHGGLIGIMLAGIVESRRLRTPFLRLCDVGAVAAPVGFLLGRLANFINGELWGRVADVPWAMVFPGAGSLPRHPSQLYEAALEGGALLVVMVLLARRERPDGVQLGWLLVLYGCVRTVLEMFREPDAQLGLLLRYFTMGQLLSVPIIAGGVWLLTRGRKASGGRVGG